MDEKHGNLAANLPSSHHLGQQVVNDCDARVDVIESGCSQINRTFFSLTRERAVKRILKLLSIRTYMSCKTTSQTRQRRNTFPHVRENMP